MKGCVISAPMTGSGKTTVTLGLLAALRTRGISVQPFKVGPDFIDPGLHEIAAGAMSEKDVAIVEGVMGLYDGFDGKSEKGSTAEMAKWLDLPLILVIDTHAVARSAAAIVHGLRSFDSQVKIAGIILNRVAGEGHYRILSDAIIDTPILGSLPADPSIEIPERHLGLLTAKEERTVARIQAIGEFFQKHIRIDGILNAMPSQNRAIPAPGPASTRHTRVALAHDKAFSFYYHANRLELERAGAQITEFSLLADANASMRASVRRFVESGKKFYAECGGLMYLARSINGAQMAGVLPVDVQMTDRLVDFGYCEVTTRQDSILGPAGTTARGHQFHYSRCVGASGSAYSVRQGAREYSEGFVFPNGIASYVHLHFLSNPALARNMLQS